MINEPAAVRAFDPAEGRDLESMNISFLRDGERFSRYSSVFSREEIGLMLRYARELARQAVCGIYGGVLDITPVKNAQKDPCAYCRYFPICKYDNMPDNIARDIKSISREEFFTEITTDGTD